jgi:hypothetical protein
MFRHCVSQGVDYSLEARRQREKEAEAERLAALKSTMLAGNIRLGCAGMLTHFESITAGMSAAVGSRTARDNVLTYNEQVGTGCRTSITLDILYVQAVLNALTSMEAGGKKT